MFKIRKLGITKLSRDHTCISEAVDVRGRGGGGCSRVAWWCKGRVLTVVACGKGAFGALIYWSLNRTN